MPFVLRPYRRVPLPCFVTYNAGSLLTQPLACVLGFWSLITLLFLSSGPAYAGWVAVEKDYLLPGLQTVYVDNGPYVLDKPGLSGSSGLSGLFGLPRLFG